MKIIRVILILLIICASGCDHSKRALPPELAQKINQLGKGVRINEKTDQYGYSNDIPLKIAVQRFNEEFYRGEATKQPPLTEEEVLAAITDFPTPHTPLLKAVVQKIKKQKLMPKGSLLEFTGSVTVVDEIEGNAPTFEDVEFHKITLYLGLDEKPRLENALDPSQICLIRKVYYKTKAHD